MLERTAMASTMVAPSASVSLPPAIAKGAGSKTNAPVLQPRSTRLLAIALAACAPLFGCGKDEAKSQARPPVEVSVITIEPRDTPVTFEYVGQTQSSRQVQIVARVEGFLEKRAYTEGSLVKAGQVMFRQDPKPFQATLDAARGALAEQQARLQVARDNLARVKPLAARNALSQKELDDATGQEQAAAAAVDTAKANVEQARLNLGYTTIVSPLTGLSSYARVQDGAYLNPTNSLLTYVEQVDPIWINFNVSENDIVGFRADAAAGRLRLPKDDKYEVEVLLANGAAYPSRAASRSPTRTSDRRGRRESGRRRT